MIIYRHRTAIEPDELANRQARPGTHAATCHQSHQEWHYSGVVDPVFWGIPETASWKDLEDGWQAADFGAAPWSPDIDLCRLNHWSQCLPVEDARGRIWLAPIIRLPGDGGRAYSVAYAGPDFLPAPTPDQQVADAIASEAHAALSAAAAGGPGLPVRVACKWTARLLSLSHHVSPLTLAMLGLLDDALVKRVLMVAAGLDPRLDPSNAP